MEKKPESAARREIEIELQGNPYTVRELDLKAYADAENYIKSMHIKQYRESSLDIDPEIVEDQVTKMIKTPYSAEELGAAMDSASCAEYVAYLSLKHNPGVTLESMDDIIDMDNVADLKRTIFALQEEETDVDPPQADQESP